MEPKFVTFKSGNEGVQTDYNALFVKELKAKVPSAKWNAPYWSFDPISRQDVNGLVQKYWPMDKSKYQMVRITWDTRADNLTIDGVGLAYVSRDDWSWRKDCPVEFRVIEVDLKSGGSRNHPSLSGRCVIEAKVRVGAEIKPTPESVEVIETGQAPPSPEIDLNELIEAAGVALVALESGLSGQEAVGKLKTALRIS